MSGKRYTEEFKIQDVKQISDQGYSIPEVAKRLGPPLLGTILITNQALIGQRAGAHKFESGSELLGSIRAQEDGGLA
jgi:transposase